MENYSMFVKDDDQLELPPGFRFHPTDEELITHYLCKKAADYKFVATAISDVDMNKVEPWELPWKAKMGEKEWYFFCSREKKYPTGMRANRATAAGYWKATGKDKEIFKGKSLVGMKKTLVFYKGRAPKGQKTNWVSHEYGLDGKLTLHNLPRNTKNDWVICRVFNKSSKGNEHPVSNILQSSSVAKEMIDAVSILPPLMDTSAASFCETTNSTSIVSESGHVHCFSNSINAQKSQEDMFRTYLNPPFMGVSNSEDIFSKGSFTSALTWGQVSPLPGAYPIHDHGILRALMENCGQNIRHNFKTEERFTGSQETVLNTDFKNEISSVVSVLDMGKKLLEDQEPPLTSVESQGVDFLWNY